MINTANKAQRRIQIALLGYGLLLLSSQFSGFGAVARIAAIAGCLGFLLMALHSSVPGSARPAHGDKKERAFNATMLRLSTPLMHG